MAYFRQLRTKAARGPTRLHEVAGLRGLFSEDENQQGESDLAYDATCDRLQTVRRAAVSRRSARGGRAVGIDGGVARFLGGNPHAHPQRRGASKAPSSFPFFDTLFWDSRVFGGAHLPL